MISFSNLGSLGRLGNQMFQYAALKGIASYHQTEYSFPSDNLLHQCFQIPQRKLDLRQPQIVERFYEFDEEIFSYCECDLYGFFQSEKYFSHIKEDIRKDFQFCDIIYDTCFHYRKYVLSDEIISLHVRRGDYLSDSNFSLLDIDYYMRSLNQLPDLDVLVLSDDIEWCKKNLKGDRFKFSISDNQYVDLCLMSLCDYHIIANSSFSWWGSWLAQSKKTIAPSKWFTGDYSHWNTKDLYLPEWIII